MAETKKGYVLQEGKKGAEVPDEIDIYASKTLRSVIRNGVSKKSGNEKKPPESFTEIKTQVEDKIKQNEKDASKQMNPLGGGSSSILTISEDELVARMTKDAYSSAITGYAVSTPSTADIINKEVQTSFDADTQPALSGGFTQSPVGAKTKIREKVEQFFKEGYKPVEKVADIQKTIGEAAAASPAASLAKWFDEQEAIIDALPTMSELGDDVYEVEYTVVDGKHKWCYTGVKTPMDNWANQRIQSLKAEACGRLTTLMNKASEKINDMLQEQLNRFEKVKPFTTAIEIIKSIPSLGTIIKWATSVIDFFVGTYKMIYGIFKMAMQILELVIIRGPQLINKIMQKVTEFDCPVQFNIEVTKKEDKK